MQVKVRQPSQVVPSSLGVAICMSGIVTGVPRSRDTAPPPGTTIRPWADFCCGFLGRRCFLWARYPCIVGVVWPLLLSGGLPAVPSASSESASLCNPPAHQAKGFNLIPRAFLVEGRSSLLPRPSYLPALSPSIWARQCGEHTLVLPL